MAAPPTTARVAPTGIKLDEGYQVLFAFSLNPSISVWEKSAKLPGISNGDPIPRTTQHNTTYHTKAPRKLNEITDGSMKVGYDPNCINQILAIVGKEGAMTAHLPDGSTQDQWAYIKDFQPGEFSEGSPVEADMTIVVTNWDPVNRVEAGPVLTSVAGT